MDQFTNTYIEALECDGQGDWKKAHILVQDLNSRDAAWIHAYLHRKEQIIVVTHAEALVAALCQVNQCVHFRLEKNFGATELVGVDPFDVPRWKWPAR